MKSLLLASALLIGLVSTTDLMAQTATPVIREKQANQQARIRQGARSGQITPAEKARLEAQQARIRRDKRMAKADGVVTPEERAKIAHEQRRASQNIAAKKHNARARY